MRITPDIYNNKSGYIDIFQPPGFRDGNSTIYAVTDTNHNSLCLILLSTSSFYAAYKIASQLTYKNVYLIPCALDNLLVSDVLNLYLKLKPLKRRVAIVYPERPKTIKNDQFLGDIISQSHYVIPIGGSIQSLNPIIDFKLSRNTDRPFYDIILRDSQKAIYFLQYMDSVEKVQPLIDDPNIDEIHMAYMESIYGGWNYDTAIANRLKLQRKGWIHSFRTSNELQYAMDTKRMNIPEVKTDDFI